MAQLSMQILLEAEDRASATVEKFAGRTRQSVTSVAMATREGTQTIRAMTTGLLGELSPALAQATDRLSMAAREARRMPGAFGAATVALAAASIVVGGMVQSMNRTIEASVRLDRAVKAMDLSGLRTQAQGITQALEETDRRSASVLGRAQNFFAGIMSFLQSGRGPLAVLNQQLLDVFGAYQKVFPREVSTATTEATLQQLQATKQLLETERAIAVERGDLPQVAQKNQQIAETLERIVRAERDVVTTTIQLRKASEEAAFPEGMVPGAVLEGLPKIAAGLQAVAKARADVARTAGDRQGAEAIAQTELARLTTLRQIVMLGGDYTETVMAQGSELSQIVRRYTQEGLPVIEAAIVAETKKKNLLAGQVLEIQFQTEALQRQNEATQSLGEVRQQFLEQQKIGADAATRAALDLQQIEEARLDKLKAASLITDQNLRGARELAIDAEAATKRATLAFAEMARTNPLVGLAVGFQEAADEAGSAGLRMQAIARGTADNMHRAFSDSFFSAVTGDFKKLPEISRQFGAAMVRTIIDELSRLALAPIFRQLRAGFGTFGGAAGVVPFLPFFGSTAGGAAGAGGAVPVFAGVVGSGAQAVAGGGSGAISLAGASSAQIAQLQQQGVQVVQSGGQMFGIPPVGTFTTLLPGGGVGLVQSSGAVIPISGGLVSDFLAAPLFQTAAGVVPGTSLAAITAGQALGIAGAAAGLGLTVYSALQGPPTAENIVFSAASGGLSGAVGGAIIGSMFGGPGIGTAIGAIAGAVIGGGAGALGKGGQGKRRPSAMARSAAEAQAAAGRIEAAIANASTLQDLADIFNRRFSAFGEAQIFMWHNGAPDGQPSWWAGDWDDPASHFFVPEDFLDPANVDSIEIWIGATGSPSLHAGLTDAMKAKVRQITGDIEALRAGITLGFEETLQVSGGAAITRATVLSATRSEEARGQQIMVFEETILGLSDIAKEFLLRELARLDADKDLRIIRLDPGARVPLAVGAYTLPAGT